MEGKAPKILEERENIKDSCSLKTSSYGWLQYSMSIDTI